jgi:hypothetical protein
MKLSLLDAALITSYAPLVYKLIKTYKDLPEFMRTLSAVALMYRTSQIPKPAKYALAKLLSSLGVQNSSQRID